MRERCPYYDEKQASKPRNLTPVGGVAQNVFAPESDFTREDCCMEGEIVSFLRCSVMLKSDTHHPDEDED